MDPSYKSDLTEYISQCKARLESVLQGLGWTEVATLKHYNGNSIASSSRNMFKNPCSTAKPTFPDSCVAKNSVVLETPKLQALLENNELKAPDNFNELQGNFSREQKLKLYEHAIDNTRKVQNNLLDKDAEGEISLADILAQKKREEKRKKRRYRKSKPTHIEEVRCLVDLQMQALEQFLCNKIKKVEDATLQMCSQQKDCQNEMYPGERSECREIKISHRRSLNEEPICHMQSSNHDISYVRKRECNSRDKVRRHRSISSSEDIRRERKKHGSKRHKSKERRKHRRRSRSHSKKISKEEKPRSHRRSRSHCKKSPMKRRNSHSSYEREDSRYQKYSSRTESASHSRYSKGKHSYRNPSSSPENYRKKHKKRVKVKDD